MLAGALSRSLIARNAAHARPLSRAFASLGQARRSYATTTRATKPTATVKKAVKKAAAAKPAPKKTATTAKKAAPKKATATKTKTAARTKAKKPAAKKAAPKKRVKKPLTDEEKLKAKIRDLRAKALKEPTTTRPVSGLNAYVAATTAKADGDGTSLQDSVRAFKNLTPAEHEHWNHVANEQTAARRAEYQAFIRTHTPEQIAIANRARAQLRKLLADKYKGAPAHTRKLVDDRAPKPTLLPYAVFLKERHASGDFKSIKVTDAIKLIANEWKSLSAAEKQKYLDNYTAQKKTAVAA
ncbi:hypothetical protein ACET3X_009837 [Alternaria dauci]|uniref:HMG box domain-containing protein n=1 Tax=Alternaria dauci TaxID=48095 RepID=A0ABR3U6H7_9PLEO